MTGIEKNDLAPSFIETLRTSGLSGILQDFSEITIDAVLDESLAKEIPIIGTIVRLGTATIAIRDRILVKKILAFLQGFDKITEVERQEFSEKINSDEKFERRVGEMLIMLLDRYDHFDKARLLARLLRGYLRGDIDFDEFSRFAIAIDRAFIQDLNDLLALFSGQAMYEQILWANLFASGLSRIEINAEAVEVEGGFKLVFAHTVSELVSYSCGDEAMKFAKAILGNEYKGPPL